MEAGLVQGEFTRDQRHLHTIVLLPELMVHEPEICVLQVALIMEDVRNPRVLKRDIVLADLVIVGLRYVRGDRHVYIVVD